MTSSILGNAVSGLSAYQTALDITSNNISNANTAGYSVQRVEIGNKNQGSASSGFNIGNGVTVARNYDQFITAQVRSSTSAYQSSSTYYTMASQIDNMIANQDTGLSKSMNSFFSAVNGVANDPTSIPSRQVMLSDGAALANQFNSISNTFSNLGDQVNGNLSASVGVLNGYAKTLAQLNAQIVFASNNGTYQSPNQLLDQRDQLLNKIAEQVNVAVVKQTDGAYNVFMGQGQPLVVGATTSTLTVQSSPNDVNHMQVALNGQDISKQVTGGQIGGYLQFRDQVLDPARAQLGLLATGVATEFNNVHQAGIDLNGAAGLAFFNLGSPSVAVQGQYSDPNLVASASFVAPSSALALGASYRIDVTSSGFSLTNLSDNTVNSGLSAAALAAATTAAGFNINFSGGSLNTGDSFIISPNANAAATIQVNPAITDPKQIAAATSATSLPGDNSNALALAKLQTQTLMQNGSSTFSQMYSQLVTNVGDSTNNAQLSSSAQNSVLQSTTSAQQSISGVNLDEEAANLVKYQNAYAAAAKTVAVAKTLFDTMLNAVA